MQIYVIKNNEKTGPFSLEQVHATVQTGLLKYDDLCWHDGIPNWIPISALFSASKPLTFAPPPLDAKQNANLSLSDKVKGPLKWGAGALVACYILTLLMPLAGLLLGILAIFSTNPQKKKQGAVLFGFSVLLIIIYAIMFSAINVASTN